MAMAMAACSIEDMLASPSARTIVPDVKISDGHRRTHLPTATVNGATTLAAHSALWVVVKRSVTCLQTWD